MDIHSLLEQAKKIGVVTCVASPGPTPEVDKGGELYYPCLWSVDDDSTYLLMKKIYTEIFKNNLSPASALRKAQFSFIGHKKYQDPSYWAAFVIYGD